MKKFETKLHAARGLGSSKTGTGHWWAQRVTGTLLALLFLWFVSTFVMVISSPYEVASTWLHSPWVVTLLALMMGALFYHGALGMQVIIEDYVHHEGMKLGLLLAVKGAALIFGLLSLISLLRIFVS